MNPRDVLISIPFFANVLDRQQIEMLADGLRITSFARGVVLMRQGEIGASMFVIVSGALEVAVHVAGGRKVVARLGPGDVVGEMSLMTGAYRSATVTATRAVTAVEIGKPSLRELLATHPGLIRRFAGMIEQRQAELDNLRRGAARGSAVGLDRGAVENLMRSFYAS
jgi:CRP-like cAMP-binding protein